MDVLQNLKTFLAVARLGSFSAAGRHLNVATSVVSARIDQLEWTVKSKLFSRSTRQVMLTELGQQSLSRVQVAVAELDGVLEEIRRGERGEVEGHLRVKAPTTLTLLYVGAVLARFQAAHPRISLDIVLADRPLNPVEEGFDVAIVAFPAAFPGVVDVPLCPLRRVVCAAPAYLQRRGMPSHPRELVRHDVLNFQPTGPVWLFESLQGPVAMEVRPKLNANDNQMLLLAALEGNGVALLASYVAQPALRSGALVQVLTEFTCPELWVKALVPEQRIPLARVRTLINFLEQALGPVPPWEIT